MLHFRPVRYERFSQALELTSGELIPGQVQSQRARPFASSCCCCRPWCSWLSVAAWCSLLEGQRSTARRSAGRLWAEPNPRAQQTLSTTKLRSRVPGVCLLSLGYVPWDWSQGVGAPAWWTQRTQKQRSKGAADSAAPASRIVQQEQRTTPNHPAAHAREQRQASA